MYITETEYTKRGSPSLWKHTLVRLAKPQPSFLQFQCLHIVGREFSAMLHCCGSRIGQTLALERPIIFSCEWVSQPQQVFLRIWKGRLSRGAFSCWQSALLNASKSAMIQMTEWTITGFWGPSFLQSAVLISFGISFFFFLWFTFTDLISITSRHGVAFSLKLPLTHCPPVTSQPADRHSEQLAGKNSKPLRRPRARSSKKLIKHLIKSQYWT